MASETAIVAVALAFGVYALFHQNLALWPLGDDYVILTQWVEFHPWQFFGVPEAYQALSPHNLTPWVTLSLGTDLSLSGMDGPAFYLHHLFSLWLMAFMSYGVLRLWVGVFWSAVAVGAIMLSEPVRVMAMQLYTRHYIEGMICVLLATWFLVTWERGGRRKPWRRWVAVGAYVIAVTAKEIFVPFVLLVPCLLSGKFTQRIRSCVPFILAAATYCLWRYHMLGKLIGGYPLDIPLSLKLAFMKRNLLDLPGALFAAPELGYILLGLLTIILPLAVVLRMTRSWQILVPLVIVIAPVLPVLMLPTVLLAPRWLFLPAWMLVAASAIASSIVLRNHEHWLRAGAVLVGVLVLLTLPARTLANDRSLDRTRRLAEQVRFVYHADGKVALLLPSTVSSRGKLFIKLELLHSSLGAEKEMATIVSDPIFLSSHGDGRRLFVFDRQCTCIVEVTGDAGGARPMLGWRVSKDVVFEGSVWVDADSMSWNIVVPGGKKPELFIYDQKTTYKVPWRMAGTEAKPHWFGWLRRIADGSLEGYRARLRIVLNDGSFVYSPPFNLEDTHGKRTWDGPAGGS